MKHALRDALNRLHPVRMAVLGDMMLDRYVFGNVDRISPEAPVGILTVDSHDVRPGGAACVASFAAALGARVTLAGVLGDNPDGNTLLAVCKAENIDTSLVIIESDRITTRKDRFVGRSAGRHEHQMLRVDHECTTAISQEATQALANGLSSRLAEFDVILVADYAKGVCSKQLLDRVVHEASQLGIPTLVDPGRGKPVDFYTGATLIKPNRAEAESLSRRIILNTDDALKVAEQIRLQCRSEYAVVTLDQDGCVVVDANSARHVPAEVPQRVYDICGAGDMFLAMLGVSLANGQSVTDAAGLANLAAGIEVQRMGTIPVHLGEIRSLCDTDSSSDSQKLVSISELSCLVKSYKAAGQQIVFTNGCFDLLHAGHIRCLTEAAQQGDVLIVGVNSDDSVRALKGPDRPICTARERAELLGTLACVNRVVVFDDDTPMNLLNMIRPDVLVKGGTTAEVVGRGFVESYGGRVFNTQTAPGVSTSHIIGLIQDRVVSS